MAEKIIDKLVDLEYNEQVTLSIVEGDEDLRAIFLDESKAKSFIVIRQLLKENVLRQESRDFLRGIFDQVICTKQSLVDMYMHLLNGGTAEIQKVEEAVIPTIVEPIIEKTEVIIAEKVIKAKPEKELPRRYGKEKILKDIEEQGGKATPLQNAMLKVNQMKNTYVNLNARLIKDMFLSERILTDEDYRTIHSVMLIMERKLEDILKKK